MIQDAPLKLLAEAVAALERIADALEAIAGTTPMQRSLFEPEDAGTRNPEG